LSYLSLGEICTADLRVLYIIEASQGDLDTDSLHLLTPPFDMEKGTQAKPVLTAPMASPPPEYKPSPTEAELVMAPAEAPPEHHHAAISAQQDLQYHQLFTRPATDVYLSTPVGPVAKLVTTYGDSDEHKSNDPRLSDGASSFNRANTQLGSCTITSS
jgi:hypothetical protein